MKDEGLFISKSGVMCDPVWESDVTRFIREQLSDIHADFDGVFVKGTITSLPVYATLYIDPEIGTDMRQLSVKWRHDITLITVKIGEAYIKLEDLRKLIKKS